MPAAYHVDTSYTILQIPRIRYLVGVLCACVPAANHVDTTYTKLQIPRIRYLVCVLRACVPAANHVDTTINHARRGPAPRDQHARHLGPLPGLVVVPLGLYNIVPFSL